MNIDNIRHSCAHLLAAAVLELWPEAKPTIGPAVENGFYYDFDFEETKISVDDLQKIEARMHELAKDWKNFERIEVTNNEAIEQFNNNKYKLELIWEFSTKREALTLYKSGNFIDLCRGGHVDNPAKELKYFKLLSVAGAYWRGDEKKPMLTRIYGTAFPNQAELDEFLKQQEAARLRDHKKLGHDLNLFVFSETVGKGLPLWTPAGATVRRELERFIVDEELKRGYLHVCTPDIAKVDLYKKSGHYPYYKESMYAPIEIDDEQFMLRPMTCPHHFELYLSRKHSYRELPMRIAELAKLYRYEKSGELMGLLRVRTFCLADAHIICRLSQAEAEINQVLDLIEYLASVFGLKMGKNYTYRLSLGDRTDDKKYFEDDQAWDRAEDVLRQVLIKRQAQFVGAPGEAAFYGPKIDIQMKNANGKEDTAFTVQYDFVMSKRFNLTCIDEQGAEEPVMVIHRSSIGAIERVMAFLIEHFGGAFPIWLSPTQVKVLPITDQQLDYARKVAQFLRDSSVRVELDERSETLSAKIRDAQMEKIPYMLVIGKKEQVSEQVAVRTRNEENLGAMSVEEFVKNLQQEIAEKSLQLMTGNRPEA